MKRIYVSDVIHEQLKREAHQQGRTLQWLTDEKLSRPLPVTPQVGDVVGPFRVAEVGDVPQKNNSVLQAEVSELEIVEDADWCLIHDCAPDQCKGAHV